MEEHKLFVGNLSYNASETDVAEVFAPHGEVAEVILPLNRETGRRRGFAFVTMDSEESVKKALALDGTEFMGRKMVVNVANKNRSGGGGGRRPSESRGSFQRD